MIWSRPNPLIPPSCALSSSLQSWYVHPPDVASTRPDQSGLEEIRGTIIHFLLTKEAEQLAENKEALENFMTNEAKNEAKTYLNSLTYQ
jgi:hypothetical protein